MSVYVLVELPDDMPPEEMQAGTAFNLKVKNFTQTNSSMHLQGLDTEKPELELNGVVYEGHYEYMLDTALIFSKSETNAGYTAKTSLKLVFTRSKD